MGHAPGQLTDGFHLLRLTELIFQLLALGDVAGNALHADCDAVLIDHFRVDLQDNAPSIFGDNFNLVSRHSLAGDFSSQHLAHLW